MQHEGPADAGRVRRGGGEDGGGHEGQAGVEQGGVGAPALDGRVRRLSHGSGKKEMATQFCRIYFPK